MGAGEARSLACGDTLPLAALAEPRALAKAGKRGLREETQSLSEALAPMETQGSRL